MKKICFTVTTDLNYDQRMQRICGSMAKKGYVVQLVGRVLPVSLPLQPQPYAQQRLRCWFNKGKLFYAEYMLRLFFYLLRQRSDAYCAIDLDTALPVFFIALLKRKPFVYDAHEYFPEVVEVTHRKTIKAIWAAVEGFIIRRTDHAYTVTASIAGVFKQKYGASFEVIRNMPPLLPYQEPAKEPATILYQGVVNEGRGLEPLLRAMAGVEAKLVICGHGDIFEELVQLAHTLGVAHKVEFRGKVLPADLLEITRTATIGVMLLENKGLSYYYSLANKFFDYIHAATPQLVINFPEYQRLNQEYGVALESSLEVQELQDKLNLLLTDKALYQRLQQNCRAAREELNWQQEEQKLWRFYKQLWKTREKQII
ncbi:glycosyltransferase [Pontibacter beigongshangensis]|uniref:glycosyltransferase n=1 Tax=Pontibacter beigongshangensis TaxID=2574733 RepID=UPI0019D55EFC|nr:glycosyltransferase [Pontibacter beigongshangensis]